ncbi:MAG: GNAT family N-acetyltransferase [Rhodospirillales bacterium]|nr:GNAT family N-acetyltransferase [Rhodospirillales bacterium]
MPDGRDAITIRLIERISDVAPESWDACAGDRDPFVQYAFLNALEESGSVSAETGWMPRHLTVEDGAGRLAAACPFYVKSHSHGEYVFDWGWADAYHRAGGSYYPKLISAVPFTPVTGRRLLVRDDSADNGTLSDALASAMVQVADKMKASSVHVNFTTEAEWQRLKALGFLPRLGLQYHWENKGYGGFDDFLNELSSRKRKAIRKERAQVREQNVKMKVLSGHDIREEHWDVFFRFYMDTSDRKWGSPYLNREFFSLLGQAVGDAVVLVLAEAGGKIVGGALNLKGRDTLYGRYWGCTEAYKFLHFEACYYQAIDYAIEHGLAWVEAGAQGPHKIQRGYLPRRVYSAHWIADPNFRDAVDQFVRAEAASIDEEIRDLIATASPYKKAAPANKENPK